jgi:predicted PurR-regulated permease PerM
VRVEEFLSSHRSAIVQWTSGAGSRVAQYATNTIWLILVPILAAFFLRDGRHFADTMVELVDRRSEKQLLRGLLDDLHVMLASYIRAQLLLALISGAVYTIVLTVLRVPYSFVLGAVGGVLEFIPVLGPLVAAVSILAVALLSNYSHILVLVLFLGAWRLIQDYVNAPRIMGRQLELHPLATLFGILAGGEIAGVLGVYLSVPVMATLRIFWKRWQRYEKQQKPAQQELRAA